MIINVCLNDNQAARAFKKSSKFCETCGKPYLKISVYPDIDVNGNAKIVLEQIKDDPSVLGGT